LSERSTLVDPSMPIRPIDQPARLAALVAAVRARTSVVPEVGIVLGSGLGGLADELANAVAIPFAELPGWPAATAPGHAGRLLLGDFGGRPVAMLQGRFHLYEGNDPGLVVQPVLLFHALGARVVVLTNAAGGLDPSFGSGTLMVMRDHINLTGRSPLMGPNADELGPRFPDMTEAWSPRLRERLHAAGVSEGVMLEDGVYVGLTGPTYETPAEVRMLAGLGGHAVGMSTVLECIAARWVGLEVCGVSLVTNAGAGYSGVPLTHEEVLEAGLEAGPRLAKVIRRFIADLAVGCGSERARVSNGPRNARGTTFPA
jgi:purine-nucleoside phosphorylase